MGDARWEQIKAVFSAAVELAPEERVAFLDRECAGDAELRREVDSLLEVRTIGAVRTAGAAKVLADAPTASGASSPLTEGPGTRIGPYKLLQLIGEGGFGSVFMAEQERPLRRRVALKIIKLGMDTRAVIARFEAERQALAMMDHPNIARVLDAGATESGRPYFVMELVRGVPITTYCDGANLSAAERLELVIPVCQAVQHAHQKGIIHRDLKPSNILVTLHDGKPVPKVIDFGIAKATASRLTEKTLFTEHRQLIGTPAYMSPEQAEMSGLDIDTRADIYSLGVLLYELLTGATPFDTRQLMEAGFAEIQRVIREVEPVKPSTRVSTLGDGLASIAAKRRTEPRRLGIILRGDLDWIVMKALEKDRTRRYDTATGLADDLRRHLSGDPVVAAPPSAGYRVRKFVRRNRRAVTAAIVLAATLVAGVAGTSTGFLRARAQTRVAEDRSADANIAKSQAEAARELEAAARADAVLQKEAALRQKDDAEFQTYVANLQFAQASQANNETGPALLALEDSSLERFRGWEWKYLHNLSDQSLLVFRASSDRILQAVYAPGSSRVVTMCGSGTDVSVWNRYTGALLSSGAVGDLNTFPEACLGKHGNTVLIPERNSAALWDVETRANIASCRRESQREWSAGVLSPDGHRAILQGRDLSFWNADLGTQVVLPEHAIFDDLAVFSPDGQRIIYNAGGGPRVWNVGTGTIEASLQTHGSRAYLASFSVDGRRVAIALDDQSVVVWDIPGARQLAVFEGHTALVVFAGFVPSGHRILTASNDGSVRFCDIPEESSIGPPAPEEPNVSSQATPMAHAPLDGSAPAVSPGIVLDTGIEHAALRPDGLRLAVTTGQGALRIIDCVRQRELVGLAGHTGHIQSVDYSDDGRTILTTSWDGTARQWDGAFDAADATVLELQADTTSAGFSRDGSHIVSNDWWRGATLWDAATGSQIGRIDGDSLGGLPMETFGFSPDGSSVIGVQPDGTAFLWDSIWDAAIGSASRWNKPKENWEGYEHAVSMSRNGAGILVKCARYATIWSNDRGAPIVLGETDIGATDLSPDGLRVVIAHADQKGAAVAKVPSMETVCELLGCDAVVTTAKYSPDGTRIVTAHSDHTGAVWDAVTGARLRALPKELGQIEDVVFSPDGSLVFTSGKGETGQVWNIESGALATLHGHNGPITCVAFSPDSARIATGSADTTVRIWEPRSGRELMSLRWHNLDVVTVAFSPDGRRLLTADRNSAIIYDSVPTRERIPQLEARAAVRAAAKPMVDASWDAGTQPKDIAAAIRANAGLTDSAREAALEILAGDVGEMKRGARERVKSLLHENITVDRARAALGADSSVSARERAEATRLLEGQRPELETLLLEAAWDATKVPGAPADRVKSVLQVAQTHVNQEDRGWMDAWFDILAAAQYRLGHYTDALDMVDRCEKRRRETERSVPRLAILALKSMCSERVSRHEAALASLRELSEIFPSPIWRKENGGDEDTSDVRALLREAESLIEHN